MEPEVRSSEERPVAASSRSGVKIEDVIDTAGGRFAAVILAARRAREITSYFNQLGEGIGSYVPPQVHSLSRKPLSIALEEIAQGKVQPRRDEN